MNRPSDDIFHRIQVLAEKRAERNLRDPAACGRKAMALLRSVLMLGLEPNTEAIISTVSGEYRRVLTGLSG